MTAASALLIVAAYIVGSIPFGILVGRGFSGSILAASAAAISAP